MRRLLLLNRALFLLSTLGLRIQTNAGKDWQARVMGGSGSRRAKPANHIGFTTWDFHPDPNDLVLEGEITGGSLKRQQAVFAHTEGSGSFTLTRLGTADRDTIIHGMGVFTEDGDLIFTQRFSEPAELQTGDPIQVTKTIIVNS